MFIGNPRVIHAKVQVCSLKKCYQGKEMASTIIINKKEYNIMEWYGIRIFWDLNMQTTAYFENKPHTIPGPLIEKTNK